MEHFQESECSACIDFSPTSKPGSTGKYNLSKKNRFTNAKTAESHICSYHNYKKHKTATLYGLNALYSWQTFLRISATGFNVSCVAHHSNLVLLTAY